MNFIHDMHQYLNFSHYYYLHFIIELCEILEHANVVCSVEGVCGVCVVDGWFTASPGLSQTDWTLAGWGCTPGVHESNHGTQDKPAINTHTRREATVVTVVPSSANTTSLKLQITPCTTSTRVLCRRAPRKAT